jgi:hypothetical protein
LNPGGLLIFCFGFFSFGFIAFKINILLFSNKVQRHFKSSLRKFANPLKTVIRSLAGCILAAVNIEKLYFPFGFQDQLIQAQGSHYIPNARTVGAGKFHDEWNGVVAGMERCQAQQNFKGQPGFPGLSSCNLFASARECAQAYRVQHRQKLIQINCLYPVY